LKGRAAIIKNEFDNRGDLLYELVYNLPKDEFAEFYSKIAYYAVLEVFFAITDPFSEKESLLAMKTRQEKWGKLPMPADAVMQVKSQVSPYKSLFCLSPYVWLFDSIFLKQY